MGTVLEIKDYGAIVQVLRNREGLLHISEVAHGDTRPAKDALTVGQRFEVKCIGVDRIAGHIKLSRKALLPMPKPQKQRKPKSQIQAKAEHGARPEKIQQPNAESTKDDSPAPSKPRPQGLLSKILGFFGGAK